MARCASGEIILSSAATRYQLGFVFHAGSVTVPANAGPSYAATVRLVAVTSSVSDFVAFRTSGDRGLDHPHDRGGHERPVCPMRIA
jgi:hypothetical protein